MKNTILSIFICASVAFANAQVQEPYGYVNDFASILPDADEKILNDKLSGFEKSTSIEFSVVTVASLDGNEVSVYTNNLFKKWGIGKSDKNNGLMILVAPNERKWRIEVGYGLEGYLTDAYTARKGEEFFKPNFRNGDYIKGINLASRDFMDKLGNETWEERKVQAEALKIKNSDYIATSPILWWVY